MVWVDTVLVGYILSEGALSDAMAVLSDTVVEADCNRVK